MAKINFKPGNMLYPLPATLISCGDIDGISNLLTVAWTGTLCTNPPMTYISVRPERHSYEIIRASREFVINLTTEKLVRATDYCGVRSGRDVNKWSDCRLTPERADTVRCPMIQESPVNIECHVTQILEPGSHHIFLADVTAVHVDDRFLDERGTLHLEQAGLIAYSHGNYYSLGKQLGSFGYSVRKRKTKHRPASPSFSANKTKPSAYYKRKGKIR